jgi:hypothetical protein
MERSAYVAEADAASLGSYIDRDQEQAILDELSRRRAVRLQGPSSAGKTRTALEILKERYKDAKLVVPRAPSDARELTRLLAQRPNPEGQMPADPDEFGRSGESTVTHVLWLDDLNRYAAAKLNAADVRGFLARAGHMVVATIRSSRFEDISQATGEGAEEARDLLGVLPPVRLSADFSNKEAQQARAAYQGRDFASGFLSFSAVEEMRNRLEDVGLTKSPEGYALVWSVIDWQRMGLHGIDDRQLRRLFPSYFKQVSVGKPTDELYEGAKRWALEPVRRKGEVLSRVTLLRGLASGEDVYDVHDSLAGC